MNANNLTATDINASIGRKFMAVRTNDGQWMLCLRMSGFMAPLDAFVIRPLTISEAIEAEASLTSPDAAISFLPF